MRAALLTAFNAPLQIVDSEPLPLQFGQVFVRVLQSGICGAQLQEWCGHKGDRLKRFMGHEAAVEVLEVGDGVALKPGQKCVAHWRKGAGIESAFPRYKVNGEVLTSGLITTFSTHSVISENRLTPVPSDTPEDVCALLGCSLSTALGTIENEADLKFGETVLIIGCGGLGANLILAAKLRQASYIGVVDTADKRAIATAMGATEFAQVGSASNPQEFLGCGVFDVVIDTTGSETAIAQGIGALGSGGRFVMVGQPNGRMTIPNARSLFDGDGKRIIATQGGQFRPDRDTGRYVSMWRAGLLKIDGLISHRLPLERINDGLDLVRSGAAGRIMVTM